MKTLREYADSEGISYAGAYKRWKDGRIIDAFQGADRQIFVGKQEEIKEKQTAPIIFDNLPATVASVDFEESYGTSVRLNKSALVHPDQRFKHLENSPVPFTYSSFGGYKQSDITVRDAIILCQRAYWGFSIFRATIELFTEFCVNNIYFKGGSKRSRQFFELFFKKIGLNKLQDIFFREFWRSGNCFIYRYYGKLEGDEFKAMVKLFGGDLTKSSVEIPIKYILLNPADVQAQGSITFDRPTYVQVLSDYERERLKNPRTPQDQAVFDSLSEEDKKKIKSNQGTIYRDLSTKDIVAIFLSKQSYEALSVPLGFGVLEHLSSKKELELMDQAIARTVQQAVLLVTTGAPKDEGGINYQNITNLKKLFESETISRTIIADYTTKVEFKIPQIGDLLDPKKYEELNQTIAIGLGNIFLIQGEKFANQNAKIDIFLQRLQGARRIFIDEFLIPEMKFISNALGFKGEPPQPYYEELDLKNEVEYSKIYVRLMELGLLTVEEGLTAIESGRLPTNEDSLESQKAYKQARDQELYKPLMAKEPVAAEGRPAGSKVPNQKKTVGPIGTGAITFSIKRLMNMVTIYGKLEEKAILLAKQRFHLDLLNDSQKDVLNETIFNLMLNEPIDRWEHEIDAYIISPKEAKAERMEELYSIQDEHRTDRLTALFLLNSTYE